MAVNMELEKNTPKEVDTQLLASNSMEFNDGIRDDDDNIRDLQDSFSSPENKTIESEQCERTVIYRELTDLDIYMKDLDDNRIPNNVEQEENIEKYEIEKESAYMENISKNDSNIQWSEATSERSIYRCLCVSSSISFYNWLWQ